MDQMVKRYFLNIKGILYQQLHLVSVWLFSAALQDCALFSSWLEELKLVESLEVLTIQESLPPFS